MTEEIHIKYPKCNVNINGNEYYDKKVFESAGKAVGSLFVLPSFLMSACCTCILSTTFIILGYNLHEKSQEYTTMNIIIYIIAICCLSLFISNLFNIYKLKKNLSMIPENPDRRPCISSSVNNSLIV